LDTDFKKGRDTTQLLENLDTSIPTMSFAAGVSAKELESLKYFFKKVQ